MKIENQFKTKNDIRGIDPELFERAIANAKAQDKTIGQYVNEALIYRNNISEARR